MAGDDSFVGRVHEQQVLRAQLDAVLGGNSRLVLVAGEPGIGKTRLAGVCAAEARSVGAIVVGGNCTEAAGVPSYWIWQQVIRALAARFAGTRVALLGGAYAGSLSAIVPELGDSPAAVDGAPQQTSWTVEEARFAFGSGIAEMLAQASCAQPMVVVLDDLHTADLPSLQVLQIVVRSLARARVLVLGTYRDVDLERLPEHRRLLHAIARGGETIRLGGLSVDEVGEYLRRSLPITVPRGLAEELQANTGGNPLFVKEVTRRLAAEHRLDPQRRLDLRGLRLPEGLRDAIRERLQPLSADCRRLLDVAAVIGECCALPLLAAACDTSPIHLEEMLHEAALAGLVARRADSALDVVFVHPLIREALYQELGAERIAVHRRVATALQRLPVRNPDQHDSAVAYHAWRAIADGDVEDAIVYARRAAERALSRWAYEDAAEHYRRALEALEMGGTPRQRLQCELLLALGAARQAAGDPAARQSFDAAAAIARSLLEGGDEAGRVLLADAALGAATRGFGSLQPTGDPGAAAILDVALASLHAPSHPGRRAMLLGRLAIEVAASRDEKRSLALSDEAEQLARQGSDPRVLATVLSDRYSVLWGFNHIERRLGLATEILDLAIAAGSRDLTLRGRGWRLIELMTVGDLASFDDELRHYEADAAMLQQPRYEWVAANARALRALWAGAWDDAERAMATALALGQQGEDQALLAAAAVQSFVLQRERGQSEATEPAVRRFAEQFAGNPIPRCFLGIIALDAGRPADARAELDRLADGGFASVRRERRVGLLPLLVELVAALEVRDLVPHLEEMLAPYAPYHVMYGPVVSFGSCRRYLARLAAVRGDGQRAERYFEAALRDNAAAGGRPMLAWTQFDYAAHLQGFDSPSVSGGESSGERAAALWAAARATAAELGMVRLQQRLDALGRPGPVANVDPPAFPATRGVFRHDGEYWTIGAGRDQVRLKDSKGLRYLALLLRSPEREFAATELAFGSDAAAIAHEVGEPVLDGAARAAYQRRLRDLREEIEEAESRHDLGAAEALRVEVEFLTDEVARAAGLHGRARRTGSATEKARLNVTRAIKTAIRHVHAQVPALGHYLDMTIHTGRLCGYTPDARLPISFDLGENPSAVGTV